MRGSERIPSVDHVPARAAVFWGMLATLPLLPLWQYVLVQVFDLHQEWTPVLLGGVVVIVLLGMLVLIAVAGTYALRVRRAQVGPRIFWPMAFVLPGVLVYPLVINRFLDEAPPPLLTMGAPMPVVEAVLLLSAVLVIGGASIALVAGIVDIFRAPRAVRK